MKIRIKDRLLSREELAAIINIKPETIAKWDCTKRYDLKPDRTDKGPEYRLSTVSAILQADLKRTGARCRY